MCLCVARVDVGQGLGCGHFSLIGDAKRVCLTYIAFDFQKTCRNLVPEIGLMLASRFHIYQRRTDRQSVMDSAIV